MRCCSRENALDTPRAAPPEPRSRTWPSRSRAALAWALPITTLALIPKCPACIAAYLLLFTGIGVSLPVAGAIRNALITLCVIAIAWFLVRLAINVRRRRSTAI